MTQSERIASSTHRGMGLRPVSQRATVVRWTPRDAARPDCVSPAKIRSCRSVSGGSLLSRRSLSAHSCSRRDGKLPTPRMHDGACLRGDASDLLSRFTREHPERIHERIVSDPESFLSRPCGADGTDADTLRAKESGFDVCRVAVAARQTLSDLGIDPHHAGEDLVNLGLAEWGFGLGCHVLAHLLVDTGIVARRHTRCNNLYQAREEISDA